MIMGPFYDITITFNTDHEPVEYKSISLVMAGEIVKSLGILFSDYSVSYIEIKKRV